MPTAGLIRHHRSVLRSRWRRLDPGRQALLALAHLRNGDTLTRLACGFEIGVHGCLKTGTTYDEHTAWTQHQQDLPTAA